MTTWNVLTGVGATAIANEAFVDVIAELRIHSGHFISRLATAAVTADEIDASMLATTIGIGTLILVNAGLVINLTEDVSRIAFTPVATFRVHADLITSASIWHGTLIHINTQPITELGKLIPFLAFALE